MRMTAVVVAIGMLVATGPLEGQVVPRHAAAGSVDHSPAQTARQLQVRDGYSVKLASAEPDVIDPVSAAWDSRGRLWVVEMPDYPHPRPDQTELHGRIRVLSDRAADGRFQQVTTFADGLNFATGVLPWREGAIVTTAGEIAFLSDTDGDGRSDTREVWFSGFTIGNEQLRANHPTLGPDGLVYVAGGLRGGKISAVSDRFDSAKPSVNLQNRDFYFDPRGGRWGTVSGKSQHGLTIDDFNRRIGCSNRNPAIESTIAADVIDRDPRLNAADGIADIGRAGFESRVVPISNAWTTSNLHAGQFSAACGVSAPGWTNGADAEWLLVCEPTGSLVQRQALQRTKGNWRSEREDEESEWLACADDWFRPVDVVPDFAGAVLVVDMSRAVIEHPHWAPPELKNRPDTWDGNDQGRIWLVCPGEAAPQVHSIAGDDEALAAITAADPLRRSLASSYWYASSSGEEKPSEKVLQSLSMILSDPTTSPAGLARTAQLLNRWDQLFPQQLALLRASNNARVRSLTVSLREQNFPDAAPLLSIDQLAGSLNDSSVLVRQSALQSIAASIEPADLDRGLIESLLKLARHDAEHKRILDLLVAMPGDCAAELLAAGLQTMHPTPALVQRGWMLRAAAKQPRHTADVLADWIENDARMGEQGAGADAELALQLVTAWKAGAATHAFSQSQDNETSWTADRFKKALTRFETVARVARGLLVDDAQSTHTRLDALQWCSTMDPLPSETRQLVEPGNPAELRAAAYAVLMQRDAAWCQGYVLDHADEISPSDRGAIVSAAKRQTSSALWLLDAMEHDALSRTFVDPASMDWFRNHADDSISTAGKRIFAPAGDVVAAMRQYAPAVDQIESADVEAGQALFVQHCASCHRIDGVGHEIGPDISDSRTKTPDAILAAILDPNAAIDASFVSYHVVTADGEAITGLLAGESSDAVTLQLAGGQSRRIDRDEIEILQTSDVSLMPSGLQRVLDVQQMRDLIGYLKRWRYAAAQ
ncbi:PVC-type heme-binding CxxCH protein [Allorhodopirellula solitaria]|uniref:Cytochrome c n=1 Tax=Allorhodopirellula solitaria TaxID=2527987 RepID=A0A5C5XTP6_9BACT|nr:PVC-type heme-binding CxxCH protein [Allorhodopirellula solitaria]TWT64992.1 Cytochrome c [Allorhodopirellula solitaria]